MKNQRRGFDGSKVATEDPSEPRQHPWHNEVKQNQQMSPVANLLDHIHW